MRIESTNFNELHTNGNEFLNPEIRVNLPWISVNSRSKIIVNTPFKFALSALLIAFLFSGCAMFEANAKKNQEAKEFLEKQKKNFTSLQADLKNRKIQIGISPDKITSLYGNPTDTFGSSSESSQFQMWTYEYPDASKKESYQSIRLYFNNGKLTYWTN